MAKGLVDGNFLCRTTPLDLATQYLTNLSDDVFITDQARPFGAEKLGALVKHTFATVSNETRAGDEIVVHFRGPRVAGADQIQMCTQPHPVAL